MPQPQTFKFNIKLIFISYYVTSNIYYLSNLKIRQLTTTTPTPSSTNLIGRQIYGGKFELAEGDERSSSYYTILKIITHHESKVDKRKEI